MERRMAAAMVAAAMMISVAAGQSLTTCTVEMIVSFTPCVTFVTGSMNASRLPTAACCDALGALLDTGTNCACLLLTGYIPFSLPFNPTLAYNLPRYCNSAPVDLFKCQAPPAILAPTGAALPPANPSPPPVRLPTSLPPFTIPSSAVSGGAAISTALLATVGILLTVAL